MTRSPISIGSEVILFVPRSSHVRFVRFPIHGGRLDILLFRKSNEVRPVNASISVGKLFKPESNKSSLSKFVSFQIALKSVGLVANCSINDNCVLSHHS